MVSHRSESARMERIVPISERTGLDATDPDTMGTTLGILGYVDLTRYAGVRDQKYLEDVADTFESTLGI